MPVTKTKNLKNLVSLNDIWQCELKFRRVFITRPSFSSFAYLSDLSTSKKQIYACKRSALMEIERTEFNCFLTYKSFSKLSKNKDFNTSNSKLNCGDCSSMVKAPGCGDAFSAENALSRTRETGVRFPPFAYSFLGGLRC